MFLFHLLFDYIFVLVVLYLVSKRRIISQLTGSESVCVSVAGGAVKVTGSGSETDLPLSCLKGMSVFVIY